MANDSSLLPATGAPPGQASTSGYAYDYSDHLDRIVTALEQMSLSMAFVADKIDNLSDNSTLIKDSLATIAAQTTTVAAQTTTVAAQTTTLASNSTTITGLATGPGIHIVGAYEVFQMVSIYKLLIEQAQILENAGASAAQIAAAQAEVTRVSQLIKSNIPRDF
jgi:hypothetical protein